MGDYYSWRDIPNLIRTMPGRRILQEALFYKTWPLVHPLAGFYRRHMLRRTDLIAVTGSFGKSTTTKAIAQALGGCRHFIQRNIATFLAESLFKVPLGSHRIVMEVGVGIHHMPAQAAMLKPQTVVVTSIGSEHNPVYPTLRQVREAKACLVRALPQSGLAVLNGDDPNVLWMAGQTKAKVVTYGFEEHNLVRASGYSMQWPQGSRFSLHLGGNAMK